VLAVNSRVTGRSEFTGCGVIAELVPLVAAGVASGTEAAEVRRHVTRCYVCRRRLEEAHLLALALREDGADLRCAAPGVAARAAELLADRLGRAAATGLGAGGARAGATETGAAGARAQAAEPASWPVRSGMGGLAWRVGPAAVVYLAVLAAVVSRLPRPGTGSPAWLAACAYAAVAGVAVPLVLIPRRLSDEEE